MLIYTYILPCVGNKWAYNIGFIQEPLANTQVRMFKLFFMNLLFFSFNMPKSLLLRNG